MPTAPPALDQAKLDATQKRLGSILSGCMVAGMIWLGDRLGLYRAMWNAGPLTSAELAARTGLHERWLREWLRAQAAAGLIDYQGDERFSLSPEAALLLADDDNLKCIAGSFAGIPYRLGGLERLAESFRTGIGVSYDDRGFDAPRALERAFKNWYRHVLVPVALPKLDGVVPVLEAGGTVADVGCGTGIALVEMAKAFPRSQFHGYDTSVHHLARAEENRAAAGVTNVCFHNAAREPLPADARFDLITTFDCLHDMTRPHEVVAAIRAAIKPDGAWFIADIDGRPTFEENLADNRGAASQYSISVLACLSAGMSEPDGAGFGTLGLPEPVMRALVTAAGFRRFDRVDLPSPVNAFYLARP
jgi:2-polyprenyl-3-methyl-5-hydroxy-6-metoxy-1,4-benzoquinol methylase